MVFILFCPLSHFFVANICDFDNGREKGELPVTHAESSHVLQGLTPSLPGKHARARGHIWQIKG